MQYKHREGSDLERSALYHGYEELLKEVHDMTFDIPEATYSFGQDVKLQVGTHCTAGGVPALAGYVVCAGQHVQQSQAALSEGIHCLRGCGLHRQGLYHAVPSTGHSLTSQLVVC